MSKLDKYRDDLEHEGEAPAPGTSDKKYDDKAKQRFKAISDRVSRDLQSK